MEKYNVFRKGLVIGIILLFIGASVVPSIAGYDKDIEQTDYIIDENETLNMKNDDYQNLIKGVTESGVISNNDWIEEDKLLSSDGNADDCFGRSVSIDGDYALIGALWNDVNGVDTGSAYVFKRDGTTWIEQDKLIASDGEFGDWFGCAVSISNDYALIGANRDDDNGVSSGSAYVFKRDGGSWYQQTKLIASDGANSDEFGFSVSLDGDYAIIGAPRDHGYDGAAYVFKRSGTSWTEQDKLLASDGGDYDHFGCSVSISKDYALIGASGYDYDRGSAYVFKRDGAVWIEQAKLLASDGAENDRFGYSVFLDGDTAIIGANMKASWKGSAYVFKRDGSTWTEESKLIASDGEQGDKFGCSVSIDRDTAIIGAHWDNDNGILSGSAYIFTRSGTTWTQQSKLLPSDGALFTEFGWSVSIDGDYVLIGAACDDDNGKDSGSAYVFIRKGDPPPDFTVDGLSPIDLNITDADGRFINKTFSNIPGAVYIEEDLDGDGELDDRIFIPDAIDGLYNIEVIPEPDAEPTDTYSLMVNYTGTSYYLAEDVMIQDIPPEGYGMSWPDKPSSPQGEINGNVGESYTYTSSTSDPDGDQIYYLFDWNDGTNSGWLETGEASHKWSEEGDYEIKVKAKDIHDLESDWSDPLIVTMPRNRAIQRPFLNFLQQYPILYQLLLRFLQL